NSPVALIEAMASGKPIVATHVGGVPEMMTDKTGLLVKPGDTEGLAEAVNYMLDHYHEYDPKVISELATARYRYEVWGRALHEIYKEVSASGFEGRGPLGSISFNPAP